ncbi:helix-turn-helix transcriptional regulator [Gryllotalpicola protaetiae]|uniref:LuxR family transcriptional regulator n=1 Tax=Gryllotalpicola protaetiae TaxID=2419771 RepID=A0A387BS50_9MICO|nr:LuxR family transcriptional regulator [Gryllotalpicola protaetiae]AYG03757.1 LuxR family transcriptional regulator [Gryllotalpicola protaetiae]
MAEQPDVVGFVGRDEELARIRSAAAVALSGQARVVWIEGPAGAGKTALLDRAVSELADSFTVVRAEADELSAEFPLSVARQLAPIDASDALGAGLQLLDGIVELQRHGPLLLVVEDLHWVDATSREAVLAAVRRLDRDQVLTIVTSRADDAEVGGWERVRLDARRCERIGLGPLTVSDVVELAAPIVALSTAAAERLHRHTAGHALYLRTLLSELRADQLAVSSGELPAPRSLAATTAARLADASVEAQSLAVALAVIGHPVRLAVAARVGAVQHPTEALESLLETGFFAWRHGDTGSVVGFAHPLLRAAVYNDLPPLRRQRLHLAAAEELGAADGLAHRVAAVDGADDALADELVAEAERERAVDAAGSAARLLLWASGVRTPGAVADRHLTDAARLLIYDGQLARAAELRAEVEATRPSPARSLVLGTLDWESGDTVAAEAELRAAADSADPGFAAESTEANVVLARLLALQGRGPEAIAAAERALRVPGLPRRLEHLAWLGSSLGVLMRDGGPASVAHLSTRLPQPAPEVPAEEVDLLVARGAIDYFAARPAAAAADLRAAIALIRAGAPAAELHRAHYQLAQSLVLTGDWDEAAIHAHTALEIVQDQQLVSLRVQAHCVLASLAGLRGHWDEADEQLRRAMDGVAPGRVLEALMTPMIARATIARARGDWADILRAFEPLLGEAATRAGIRLTMGTSLEWWAMVVSAAIEVGDFDEATRQLDSFERAAVERQIELSAALLGLRARLLAARPGATLTDAENAIALLRQAIAQETTETAVLTHVELHRWLGRLLIARGARREGLDELRVAHRRLTQLGAGPELARVAAELAAAGADPGVPATSPLSTLTERETDVAALVIRGMTNREVAGELYVTEKAVEYHLGNVYAKLGLHSRRELRALAHSA